MTSCPWCSAPFAPSGRRRFCSDACKQANWRARHARAAVAEIVVAPAGTVYECPDCESRYLGTRRCEVCNLFCRRVGPGALCPHCDEPVAHADLDD